MNGVPERFTAVARSSLHWTMAVMILSMSLIGLWLAGTVSPSCGIFLDIHRPIGVFVLVVARLAILNASSPPCF